MFERQNSKIVPLNPDGSVSTCNYQHAKIIAVDFDGCLVTNKYPNIGEPIEKNIEALKAEKKNGTLVILWTCRGDEDLEAAVNWCHEHGIEFDAVNENLPAIVTRFGKNTRKIFANEYWDDRAVLMSQQPIEDFSDGFHTFKSLYYQRCVLFAALCNKFKSKSWKSYKHSDGEECFGGGWFIVGIDTPEGPYTYHYESEFWELFECQELPVAKEWDGHTDKDVKRLLSLNKPDDDSSMRSWARREIDVACKKEKENSEDSGDWDYGCSCYESAYKAFLSICEDGHSGFSIGMTQQILNRLIDGKPLTAIEDTDDVWNLVGGPDNKTTYQCKRMSSLFKDVYPDGTVKYTDISSCICIDVVSNATYHSGLIQRILDEMYPITMPYYPGKQYRVYCEDFLTDRKKGDFDTVGIFYMDKPDGTREKIDRYFIDSGKDWLEIDSVEYDRRRARRIVAK